jgi:integrase
MSDDLLGGLKVLERKAIEPAHPRRAFSMDELGRLLAATEQRALVEMRMVRRGRNAGKPVARLSRAAVARGRCKGRERRLVYLLAAWTGLRRNEIRQLTWADVNIDTVPGRIMLRAKTTKSKRADAIPVHPQLADELRVWRRADTKPADTVFSTVPNMKCLRADLALANVADKDEAGRFVDFHSLRVSLSTMLAANRVSPRATQAIMRHTDPRLTASVYTDEKLLPLAAELVNVPSIPTAGAAPATLPADSRLQALVADLSAAQKQSLLRMLSRAVAS